MSSDTGERSDLERAYQEGKRDGIKEAEEGLPRCLPRLIRCPRCRREDVVWNPAPDQRENEDSIGPRLKVPDYWHSSPARLSPPDAHGKTHLLVVRESGKSPSYWPAELSCPRCVPEGRAAAAAWNAFMGR